MTRRTGLLLVALVGALLPLAPAAPAGAAPPKTFVASAPSGADAAPGDGVCANASGGCSLQAAFDEAIALRKGTIVIGRQPDGWVSAAVRGSITLRGGEASFSSLVVERGATLRVEDTAINDASITVRGRLVVTRSDIVSHEKLRIDPSGTLVLDQVFVLTNYDGIVNLGRLDISYSTLRRRYQAIELKLIQTGSGGTTTLLASNLIGPRGYGRACGGTAPVSQGYNLAYDGTCKLTHPTDLGTYVPIPNELGPQGTPRLDAIPAGEAGCGTTVTLDKVRAARPADGDGDGAAACDIGAWELQPT